MATEPDPRPANITVDASWPFGYRRDMNMTMRPRRAMVEEALQRTGSRPERDVYIAAAQGWGGRTRSAAADLADTFKLWRLIWTLSLFDIRLRYRGSLLGPFWLTLSTAVMIGALGFLYSRLFHTDIHSYLPFLSLSLVLWNFISLLTADGCTCFTSAESVIRGIRMPLIVHAARVVVRNVLVLAHNVVVIVAVFLMMHTVPSLGSVTILPAFVLWLVDGLAVSVFLGILCARFRDIPPIVASIMQIAFFVSPVIWNPSILAHRGLAIVLIKWNPFFALLQIVRGPLLGDPLQLGTWAIALGYSSVLILLAVIAFIRTRPRIAYWI